MEKTVEEFVYGQKQSLELQTQNGLKCTATKRRTVWGDYVYDLSFDVHGQNVSICYWPRHIRHVFEALQNGDVVSLGLIGWHVGDRRPVLNDLLSWKTIVFAIEKNLPLEVAVLLAIDPPV